MSRGKKKGGGRGNEADYSFPVGFVSSGVVNKPEDQDSAPHGAYDVQGPPTQEEGSTAPGLGSSRAPSGHGGLGFRSAGTRQQDSDAGRGDEEGDDEGDDGVLSTALGARWVGGCTWGLSPHRMHHGMADAAWLLLILSTIYLRTSIRNQIPLLH